MQFHSVYLQRRRPGDSYRDFQRLWRSHGDYAASVPAFWSQVERYVHNDPVEDAAGWPPDTALYDGIGELFYTSYANWLSIRDVMWHQVAPDEKRVFGGPPPIAVRGERTIHQTPLGTCKLFTFAKYRIDLENIDRDALVAQYVTDTLASEQFGERLSGFTVTRALTHDPGTEMNQMAQTSSNRDILFIHHFDNDDRARSALSSAPHAQLECAQNSFLEWDSRIVLFTHGWVLKGEMG